MRVLISGGAGFVASHVCDLLCERGDQVTAIDDLLKQVHPTQQRPDYLHHEVELRRSSVWGIAPASLNNVDAVIHLAARVGVGQSMDIPCAYVDTNVKETAYLLQVMAEAECPRLVIASSMSVYGEGSKEYGIPESWPKDPRSVYATTKLASEQLAIQLADYHGIECVALRYFNIYGPRQQIQNPYTGLGAIFTRQIEEGIRPTIFEDGQQIRDFIHVSDVAQATVQALDAPAGVYNIGTGVPTTVERFAHLLCEANDTDLEPEITGQVRKGDIRYCWADIRHAWHSFGFNPTVALEDGIGAFVQQ